MDFYDTGTGLAGVELFFPAVFTRPSPAQDTLAEPGFWMRRAAEIAHILRKAVRILERRLSLLVNHRDLFF